MFQDLNMQVHTKIFPESFLQSAAIFFRTQFDKRDSGAEKFDRAAFFFTLLSDRDLDCDGPQTLTVCPRNGWR
jgi:hypothetical protein